MSDARNDLTALQAAYLAEVEKEYKLRKYPDTILIERIRQNYPIIDDAENLRQKLNELLHAQKVKDAEKTFTLYQKKIEEYEKIFREEQKELDSIKSIIREVPIIISLLESALKQLPRLQEEASDADKKIHKMTTQEIKSYLKEMKTLQAQRYKIDLTVSEAMHVGKKSKKIKTKLEKLMYAFERKAEHFYESLSLLYKEARAKARSKAKKNKGKSKTKKKAKSKKKSPKSLKKTKESGQVNVENYMSYFHDTFKKIKKDFVAVKMRLHAIVPHPTTTQQTNLAADTLNRILVNSEATKLLSRIRSVQTEFEKIKHKVNEDTMPGDDTNADEVQSDIDNSLEKASKTMLDASQHSNHLRSAILNAVSEYISEQPIHDTMLSNRYASLTRLSAATDLNKIVERINDVLQNRRENFDARFIDLLKNNLAHAFKDIPYRFIDAHDTKIGFATDKTQTLVNADSVEEVLEKKSALLDRATVLLEDYSESVQRYANVYKTEQENASIILNLRVQLLNKFHKLKESTVPHSADSNINLLLGKINQELVFLSHAKITIDEAQHKASEAKTSLEQLAERISQLDTQKFD